FEHGTAVRNPPLLRHVRKIERDDVDAERRDPSREGDDERARLAGSGAVGENQGGGGVALRRIDERSSGARVPRNVELTGRFQAGRGPRHPSSDGSLPTLQETDALATARSVDPCRRWRSSRYRERAG